VSTPDDRVRAELAALPEVPMPPDVADRIALALADADDGRVRARRRRARVATPLCAAAALVALVVGLSVSGPATPRSVSRDDDLRSTGADAFGRDGAGALADPDVRRACLAGAGVPEPGAALLGGMPYSVDGTPGTLLVLGTGVIGRYRLVVVDTGCARVLAESLAGR
jgi:hypothetical protein